MAARGKYTPERVDRIFRAIAQTGKDKEGYEAGGITPETFYRWIKDKPEFSERVTHAKDLFRQNAYQDDPERFNRAVKALDRMIEGNNEVWQKTKVVEEAGKAVKTETTQHVVKRNPNPWAVALILGVPGPGSQGRTTGSNGADAGITTVDFEFEVVGQ